MPGFGPIARSIAGTTGQERDQRRFGGVAAQRDRLLEVGTRLGEIARHMDACNTPLSQNERCIAFTSRNALFEQDQGLVNLIIPAKLFDVFRKSHVSIMGRA